MSTPNPILGDDAAKLAADRKRDEEVFEMRKRAQEKERKEQHTRAVNDQINHIQHDLERKQLELRALQTEEPRLKDRIASAKRTERDSSKNSSVTEEERTVQDLRSTLGRLEQNEHDLERQLEVTRRDEHRTEEGLKHHTELKEDRESELKRAKATAEEEERTASKRLDEQERKAKGLELEIHKMQSEIDSLKREIR